MGQWWIIPSTGLVQNNLGIDMAWLICSPLLKGINFFLSKEALDLDVSLYQQPDNPLPRKVVEQNRIFWKEMCI